MGDYTVTQKLYKPTATDVVNVETDLNYNWSRLDGRIKRLIDWYPSNNAQLTGNESFENGFKYFKRETNSHWYVWDNAVMQDIGAYVPQWVTITPAAGWQNVPGCRLMFANVAGKVFMRGKIRQSSGGELPIKTLTTVATGIPALAIPTTVRHYLMPGGNAPVGQPAATLMVINTSGTIQFIKYGTAQGTAADDRYVNFSGIEYPQ